MDGTGTDDDSIPATCGNGMVDPEEDCDDGNDDPLDGCQADCRFGPTAVVFGMPLVTPQQGTTETGAPFQDSCPAGQALIGISAHVLEFDMDGDMMPDPAWLSGLEGVCGTVELAYEEDAYALHVTEGETLTYRGSSMVNTNLRCPEHHVVVGFSGRNGEWIDQLALDCAPLNIVEQDETYGIEFGPIMVTDPIGGAAGAQFDDTLCGEGAASSGTNLFVGTDIAAFGLECRTLTLQIQTGS